MLAVFTCQQIFAQQKIWDETEQEKTERLQWWTDARFGMLSLIHI